MTAAVRLERFKESLKTYRDDPVAFARYVLDFDPHEGQQRWLRNATKPENILTTGNRFGKSSIAAVRVIHRCAYQSGWNRRIGAEMALKHEGYHALNIAMTSDQARFVWAKALAMLQGKKSSWLLKSAVSSPFPKMTFANDSVFEARSTTRNGEHLLGMSVDHFNFDEAAFETNFLRIRDTVLRMRLVDRAGTLDYTSTGNGRNDFGKYFLEAISGKNERLYGQTGSSFDNKFIDQRELAALAAKMPERMRRQNIEGAIIEAGDGYFDGDDIDAAVSEGLTEMMRVSYDDEEMPSSVWLSVDNVPWFERYSSHRYVHGWDLADKKDFTVGITLDTSVVPYRVVEYERFHRLGWAKIYDRIRARHQKYGGRARSRTWIDSTGVGDVVAEELSDIRAQGFKFTRASKEEMLSNLQSMLNLREIVFPSISVLIDELKFYEIEDDQLTTDCVMSLGIAAMAAKRATSGSFVLTSVPTMGKVIDLASRRRSVLSLG